MFNYKFKIVNLNCEACVKLSLSALSEIPGVKKTSVDLKSGLAEIEAERKVSWEEIKSFLRSVDKEGERLN